MIGTDPDRTVIGLTTCLLIWLVGFIAIGGEWFGMWMSPQWNGIEAAFHFSALIRHPCTDAAIASETEVF
ncbi:DUF2165 family protein [Microvirga ossetica]|uniref:DUF2165 family protein n=1 Tax=Microvirga ossetica TaxID=1882682 RepID=UPI000C15D215